MNVKYTDAYINGKIAFEDLVTGQMIRKIRKLKTPKMSLTTLGELTDMSTSHLSAIETIGKDPDKKGSAKSIQRKTLEKILDALNVDYIEFKQEVDQVVREQLPKFHAQKKKASAQFMPNDEASLERVEEMLQQGNESKRGMIAEYLDGLLKKYAPEQRIKAMRQHARDHEKNLVLDGNGANGGDERLSKSQA